MQTFFAGLLTAAAQAPSAAPAALGPPPALAGKQAEKRGIFMNFFIENVRNVRSKACFGRDWGADPGNLSMLSVFLIRGVETRAFPRDGRPVDCVEEFLTFSGGASSSSG